MRHLGLRTVLLGIVVTAAGATGCGGDTLKTSLVCGDGTVKVGGRCLPDDDVITSCGPGTVDDGGLCQPATPPTTCGPGTELDVDGQTCIPSLRLESFRVEVVAVGCSTVVDGLTPIDVTVTALDQEGQVFAGFGGSVQLVGLGGVTLPPTSLGGFVSGTATTQLVVSGVAPAAQLAALDESGQVVSGVSEAFAVVAEVLTPAITSAPTRIREGSPFTLSVKLETNACVERAEPVASLGLDFIEAGAGVLVPGSVTVTGTTAASLTAYFDDIGDEEVSGKLAVRYGDKVATADVSVVPRIVFAGLNRAWGMPGASAFVGWEEATGGTGSFRYEVFIGTTPQTIAFGSPPKATVLDTALVPDEITISGAGLANGARTFVAVRAVDLGFTDNADQNTRTLMVVPGDALYVQSGAAGSGTLASPFGTLQQALDHASYGSTVFNIFISGDIAHFSSTQDLNVEAGTQIIGGFTVDTPQWTHDGVARSNLNAASNPVATTPSGPAITLAANTRLDGIATQATMDVASSGVLLEVTDASGVQIHNCLLRATSGVGVSLRDNGVATLSGSAVTITTPSFGCVDVRGGPQPSDGSALIVEGSTIGPCATTGFYVEDSTLDVVGSNINNAGGNCAELWGAPAKHFDDTVFTACGGHAVFGETAAVYLDEVTVDAADDCVNVAGDGPYEVKGSRFLSCGQAALRYYWDTDRNGTVLVEDSFIVGGSDGGVVLEGVLNQGQPVSATISRNVFQVTAESGVRVGLDATGTPAEHLTLAITDNAFTGTGRGISIADTRSAGTGAFVHEVTVDGNRMHDLTNAGVAIINSSGAGPTGAFGGEQTFRFRGNVFEEVSTGIALECSGSTALETIEISDNLITQVDFGISMLNERAGTGTVDIDITRNQVRGTINDAITLVLDADKAVSLDIAENLLDADSEAVELDLDCGGATADACSVRVLDNTMDSDVEALLAGVSGLGVNLEVERNVSHVGAGFLISLANTGSSPTGGLVELIDNRIWAGSGSSVAGISVSTGDFASSVVATGNQLYSVDGPDDGLGLALSGEDGSINVRAAQNLVQGCTGIDVAVGDTGNLATSLTLEGNRLAGFSGVVLAMASSGATTLAVRNNVIYATDDGLSLSFTADVASGTLSVAQNTVFASDPVVLSSLSPLDLVFSNNIFAPHWGYDGFLAYSVTGNATHTKNMISPDDESALFDQDFTAAGLFVAAPVGMLEGQATILPHDRILHVDGYGNTPVVGDYVVVGHETAPRRIVGVVALDSGHAIEVDGPDFDPWMTRAVLMLWREGTYVDGTWNVRLLPGSPGKNAGAGGLDVGAYGGSQATLLP